MTDNTYDWIIIGGGITGSALSYELAKLGLKVLLLEKETVPQNATYYSYGGLRYWWGTDDLTRQLGQESIEIQRHLSEELDSATEFRELPLILPIYPEDDQSTLLKEYQKCSIQPQYLDPQQACEIEPLLNSNAISGAFLANHAHINPYKTNIAYQKGFERQGGQIIYEKAIAFLRDHDRIKGVKTNKNNYFSENTVICAGGLSQILLNKIDINLPLYFTHSYVIKTLPTEIQMRTLVMAAQQQRLVLEKNVENFDKNDNTINNSILDAGAIQFLDQTFCLGQISTLNPDPNAIDYLEIREQQIRTQVGKLLPSLENLPGTLHHCLVAFQPNKIALVGKIPEYSGIYIFSGFTSTLVLCPPLARHFAQWVTSGSSAILEQLNPNCSDGRVAN